MVMQQIEALSYFLAIPEAQIWWRFATERCNRKNRCDRCNSCIHQHAFCYSLSSVLKSPDEYYWHQRMGKVALYALKCHFWRYERRKRCHFVTVKRRFAVQYLIRMTNLNTSSATTSFCESIEGWKANKIYKADDWLWHEQADRRTSREITERRTGRYTDNQMNGQAIASSESVGQMNRHTNRHTTRQSDKQTDRQTDKQSDSKTDTQTDQHIVVFLLGVGDKLCLTEQKKKLRGRERSKKKSSRTFS